MPDWLPTDLTSTEYLPYLKTSLSILLILILTWAALLLGRRGIRLFKKFIVQQADNAEDQRRVETLSRVFRYFFTILISIVSGMLILSELGISIAPILGAAGVLGIAVGFGAQSLVKDFFTGFFILMENQVRVGDVVKVGGKAGLVEEVTLRHVRLRDYDGSVHFVPTGMIDTVTNMTLEYSFALMEIGVAYRENVEEVFEAIRETAAGMRQDAVFAAKMLEDMEIAGVDNWADSAVIIKCRVKCVPLEQWNVRREFLRRLKATFDARGIEIPFPHLTLYPGQGKDGSAPALHLAMTEDDNKLPR